jgi:hypothetical protein
MKPGKPKTRKAKHEAAPPSPGDYEEIEKRLKAESEEAQQVARDAFQTLFADWLAARAEYERPHDDDDGDGKANEARCSRVEQLARLITTTPATASWTIWQKLEILEYYLVGYGDGTAWTDNREFAMLAGIKADLATFG